MSLTWQSSENSVRSCSWYLTVSDSRCNDFQIIGMEEREKERRNPARNCVFAAFFRCALYHGRLRELVYKLYGNKRERLIGSWRQPEDTLLIKVWKSSGQFGTPARNILFRSERREPRSEQSFTNGPVTRAHPNETSSSQLLVYICIYIHIYRSPCMYTLL